MSAPSIPKALKGITDAELQEALGSVRVVPAALPNATHVLVNGQPLSIDQAAALRKPPLGAEPRQIWLEKRAHNLARAIHEYLGAGIHEPVAEWTRELAELWTEIEKGRP